MLRTEVLKYSRFKQKNKLAVIFQCSTMCCSLNFSGRDDIGSTWTTVVNVHDLRLLPAKSSHALRELQNLSTKLSKSLFILLVSEQRLQFRNLKYSGSFFGREVLKRPGGSASETSFWILGVRSLV